MTLPEHQVTDVIRRYGHLLGKRRDSVALALEALVHRDAPVIVELGTSRSFVNSGFEGVMDADARYWNPEHPETWDWGAGIFSRIAAEAIAGTSAELHSVDPSAAAITIAGTITDGVGASVHLHQTTSTEFLGSFNRPIDLLYMDHHETCEEGARLHLHDAQLVMDLGLLAPDGIVLVDDVHVHTPPVERVIVAARTVRRQRQLHFGKGKYSIPYLTSGAGLTLLHDGYQAVLAHAAHHPAAPIRSEATRAEANGAEANGAGAAAAPSPPSTC